MAKTSDSVKVYDKVKWHWPQGKANGCTSLAVGKRHIECAMNFLKKHKLLSEEGEAELHRGKVSPDFALTSETVNHEGNVFLKRYYGKWCSGVSYNAPPDDLFLLKSLKSSTNSPSKKTQKKTADRRKKLT